MSKHRSRRVVTALAIAGILGVASSAASAQHSPALDRTSIWLGGYYSNNDTTLTANGEGPVAGVNGKLKFEDDLGFRKRTTDPRLRLDFLIGDSQGFSFDYFQIHRNRSKSYTQPIPALDTDIDAHIKSRVDYDFGSASYKWWFGHDSDVFGVGLGAAYYKVDMTAQGWASGGGESTSGKAGYEGSAYAPMLTLGWRHAFNDQWRMYADVAGVKKNGGELNGHIWNAALGVEWFPWQNAGFGLEYSASRLHVNKKYDNAAAKLDLKSDGPTFYLRLRF